MKKISFAIIAAAILIATVFAACNGADSGKVSDTSHNDPILTTLEEMMTEAATDIGDLFTEDMSDNVSDNFSSNTSSSANTIAE